MNISVIYRIYHRSCDFSTKPAWVCSNGLVGAQLYAKPDGWIAEEDRVLRRSSVAEALEDRGSRSSTPSRFLPSFFQKALIELRQRSSETPRNLPSRTTMRHRSKDLQAGKILD